MKVQSPRIDGTGAFVATLSLDGPGIPVDEFVALIAIITKKYGKDVTISAQDEMGRMHLTKPGYFLDDKHLGYIDINTGSLVWDGAPCE
jgi:hypothetical protein